MSRQMHRRYLKVQPAIPKQVQTSFHRVQQDTGIRLIMKEQEAKIKIIFNIKTPIENFDADPGRIRQMMHNLIRNSIEAIDSKADGLINIIIKPKEINKIAMIEITVEDNGGGFKSQSLEQVFDPYVTSKPKGTGLGLAIVKKLVEEHMGSIEAVSYTHLTLPTNREV